jgi:hypothetical protein
VGLDEADDGGCPGAVLRCKESASTFRFEQFFQRELVGDDSSFIFVPKLHLVSSPGKSCGRQVGQEAFTLTEMQRYAFSIDLLSSIRVVCSIDGDGAKFGTGFSEPGDMAAVGLLNLLPPWYEDL